MKSFTRQRARPSNGPCKPQKASEPDAQRIAKRFSRSSSNINSSNGSEAGRSDHARYRKEVCVRYKLKDGPSLTEVGLIVEYDGPGGIKTTELFGELDYEVH